MIIVLKQHAPADKVQAFCNELNSMGFQINDSVGSDTHILGLIGDTKALAESWVLANPVVETCRRVSEPYKKANRKFHPDDTIVDVGGHKIGGGYFAVMSGPCSVESKEQITFVASGNPLYLSAEDVQEMIRQHNESKDAHPKKADLGEDGKVLPEQLPEMDVSTAMAGFDTKDSLADADGIVITDSAADNTGKRVLWSKVKELQGKLYVPLTRKINNKALSSDITLSAADVGAAAASHTHALDALTGILPVNKGGTGQSSLEALLAALKQAGAVQIATGSYVGTGTYGADHPCSLTFDFLPTLIWLFGAGFGDMRWNSQTLANKSIVSPGDLTAAYQKYPFPFEDGYQSGGGAYPYEYVLEHYAAFQNNTLRWYTSYTQKSGNSQPVEMDSAVYQLNAAGTNYGWIAFG